MEFLLFYNKMQVYIISNMNGEKLLQKVMEKYKLEGILWYHVV